MPQPRGTLLARLALAVAIVALGLLVVSGPGYRAGVVPLGVALLRLFAWAAYGGIAASVLAVVALIIGRGRARTIAAIALVLGVLGAFFPVRFQQTASAVPAIHDITTDTVTPPMYVAAAAKRRELGVTNSLEVVPDVVARQIAAYPDVQPLFLAVPPDEAYRRALALVTARGWEVLAAVDTERRIEATATTRWFGFKDDVVVRVSTVPDGTSRVDMRSASRLGRSDLGTNARRVREFLADLAR